MKICLLSAANNVHTMRWANALSQRGHLITVVSCKDHMPDSKIVYEQNVEVLLLKHSSGLGYYLNARQLKHIIDSRKFDIVNVHYASGYGTLGRRAKLRGALLNIWGSDVYIYPYKNKFNLRTIKKNLAFYKYVASTSNCMARQAKKFVDRDYFIIPFGVDIELFKPLENLRAADKITVGTVKTLSPIYGISDSIKAFNEVLQKLRNEKKDDTINKLCFEIYGRGEQREELQQLINELELQDKLTLCGYVENRKLPLIYNRFDIFVCNSYSESFGVAAIEAMACGVPVQASDADGFLEIIDNGLTGLIAPKGNVHEIAEKIYVLLMDEQLRSKMSAAALENVKIKYSWHRSVDIMEKFYHDMVI